MNVAVGDHAALAVAKAHLLDGESDLSEGLTLLAQSPTHLL